MLSKLLAQNAPDFNAIQSKAGISLPFSDVGGLITLALKYIFTFAGIALLVYFIFGGFHLFTSGGDQRKIAEGQAAITNALLGFLIVFVAFWIVQLFGNLLGLQPLIGSGGLFQ